MTRTVVLGAGAVGATIGGRLHEAGHDVLLVARGAHAEVMATQGLRLAMPDRVLQLSVAVSTLDDLVLRPDDVLLIATKLQHADEVLRRVAALDVCDGVAGDRLPVFCAQNGVAGERMALRRFARVHGVCVMLPATHLEPGSVAAQGAPYTGSLDLGRYPVGDDDFSSSYSALLREAGFLSAAREDVMPWKRAKLLRNVTNALTVLAGPDLTGQAADELRRRARAEAEQAFVAAGLAVVDDAEWTGYSGSQVEVAEVEGEQRGGGSSWQSALRGGGSIESDYLNGEIVLLGREHGVPTPVNAALQREANAVVLRGHQPGGVDLTRLLASLPLRG